MNSIKERRLACGLTQRQLAEKVGVSRTTVQDWENGRYRPEEARLSALATALGCDAASIGTPAKKKGGGVSVLLRNWQPKRSTVKKPRRTYHVGRYWG